VLEDVGRVAVNLEPRQRFAEWTTMHQRAPRARRQRHVREAALQAENLTQALDVATRQRQHAERQSRLLANLDSPALLAVIRMGHRCVKFVFGNGRRRQRSQRMAERQEHRAEQDGVGQRVGSRVEASPVRVERRQRLP
jgi:hypothetical protein